MTGFEYNAHNPQLPVAYATWEAMHTRCEAILPGLERPRAEGLAGRLREESLSLDKVFNRFDPHSELFRVNFSGAWQAMPLSEELYEALSLCEEFRRTTAGYFDIAVQSSPRPKGEAFSLDEASRSVRLSAPGVVLDLGGFAKGYALERLRRLLTEEGVGRALLNFGDSSILGVGTHPHGESWPVGLAAAGGGEPGAPSFALRDSALSVSGHPAGEKPHILSPSDGRPVTRPGVVAVAGPSALVAEVLSTALFAAPDGAWDELLNHYAGYRICWYP